jgi:hypothetical protein
LKTQSPPTVVLGTSRSASSWSKHLKPLIPEQVETAQLLRPGARVSAVYAVPVETGRLSAYGFGLSALLEDEASVVILPSRAPRQRPRRDQIADWEVFTPYERYLKVGPGLRWSYLPSRTPSQASA